jgi:hypothetical protein
MRWLKWILAGVAGLLLGGLVLVLIGWAKLQATPDWYHLPAASPAEREEAARRVENKLALIQNEAARVKRDQAQVARDRAVRDPARHDLATQPAPIQTIEVSFSEAELNAFYSKWSSLREWQAAVARHVQDPVILLKDQTLILAARLPEHDLVASVHLRPEIDDQGRLVLEIARVWGGTLPLPAGIFNRYTEKLRSKMARHLPDWREAAAFDARGSANSAAIQATFAQMMIDLLEHRPSNPVFFLPLMDQANVPVRLREIQIQPGILRLVVEPMDEGVRKQLLQSVREGQPMTLVP